MGRGRGEAGLEGWGGVVQAGGGAGLRGGVVGAEMETERGGLGGTAPVRGLPTLGPLSPRLMTAISPEEELWGPRNTPDANSRESSWLNWENWV